MSQDKDMKKPADKAVEGKPDEQLDEKDLEKISGGPIYGPTSNQVSQLNPALTTELLPAVMPSPTTKTSG